MFTGSSNSSGEYTGRKFRIYAVLYCSNLCYHKLVIPEPRLKKKTSTCLSTRCHAARGIGNATEMRLIEAATWLHALENARMMRTTRPLKQVPCHCRVLQHFRERLWASGMFSGRLPVKENGSLGKERG